MRPTRQALESAVTVVLLISGGTQLGSAPNPEPSRVERLAALAKLWGAVKLFHPYVVEQNLDWDDALIRTIPKVESAGTPDEYRQAIDFLLVVCGCPAIYAAVAFARTTLKVGFVFLVIPFTCWLLFGFLVCFGLLSSRKARGQGDARRKELAFPHD